MLSTSILILKSLYSTRLDLNVKINKPVVLKKQNFILIFLLVNLARLQYLTLINIFKLSCGIKKILTYCTRFNEIILNWIFYFRLKPILHSV